MDDSATKLISGLLSTERAEQALGFTVEKVYTVLTSKNPESIEINLTGIKQTVSGILALVSRIAPQTPELSQLEQLPVLDKVTVLDAAAVPNVYQLGVTLLWLGPIALLVAFLLLAVPIFRNWKNKHLLN